MNARVNFIRKFEALKNAENMSRVGVVSVVQTNHGWGLGETVRELVYEVTKRAIREAGLTRDDIGTVITSSSDFWQGSGCSNVFHFDAAGAYLKDSPKVEEDSAMAFIYGCMRILSGHFDTALIVSVTKCSEIPSLFDLTSIQLDPFYHRPIGLNDFSAAALQAQLYMKKYGITDEQRADVVVKNLKNALNNPYAHRKMSLKVEDVLRSKIISYPLRELECAWGSDGACAVILASEERAKKITDTPVWVKGFGWCVDHYFLGDRELLAAPALKIAAERAYKMAGIEDPLRQIDVAEICEPFSIQELIWYEGLGFCPPGGAVKLLDEGVTRMGGQLPVNPSGGVLSTNPYVARGLVRIVEAVLQVRGEAERRQVPDVETALAHSTHGLAGSFHSIVILGR
jgi:acetyl-CoA C-acetyltransferase